MSAAEEILAEQEFVDSIWPKIKKLIDASIFALDTSKTGVEFGLKLAADAAITEWLASRKPEAAPSDTDQQAAADRLEAALDPDKRGGWTRLQDGDDGRSEIDDLRVVLAAARTSQPVQVEVTEHKMTMSDHSGPGHSAGDPGYCAGCYEDMIASARKRADELIEESHGPDGDSPGNSVLDEDAELLVALADAFRAARKVEVADELRERLANEVGYPAQADDYYGPEGEEFAEGRAKGYNAAFENVLAALGGGDHAE